MNCYTPAVLWSSFTDIQQGGEVGAYLSSGNVDGRDNISSVGVEATNAAGSSATHQVLLDVQVNESRGRRLENLLNDLCGNHSVTDHRLATTLHPVNISSISTVKFPEI